MGVTTAYSRYILNESNSALAIEQGLAEAEWYTPPIAREDLRALLERRDGPAVRDTILWFGLLIGFGAWGCTEWGSAWAVLPFLLYGVLYASSSDSRWHEAGHGTAFRTDWMNTALYEIASFMVMRESTPWRWSHTRHHSDTIVVGRDPEISVPRPPNLWNLILGFFNLNKFRGYWRQILLHTCGRLTEAERQYIPESEHAKVFFKARIYLLVYAGVLGAALGTGSLLPLMLVGLPNLYGAWLMPIYGFTQHAGLAENVLDHRLNCRTVRMNRLNRFLYWNMNYHVEHHMFPLVPYHALPRLHELVKADMPRPYDGLIEAWREIVPAVLRQRLDPGYFVTRALPPPSHPRAVLSAVREIAAAGTPSSDGWIEVCDAVRLAPGDVVRFDHARKTYALYRTDDGRLFATDGTCTHGNTHLAGGLLRGTIVECPKHNGRFDIVDGSPRRAPVCTGLRTYPIEDRDGRLFLSLNPAGRGEGEPRTLRFRVVSNANVATFIKELVLEPCGETGPVAFTPGDYLQIDIPAYDAIRFRDFDIAPPYAAVWLAAR
ncbi:MAG: fatty acid desaturase [Verrucomicrobia bacterium]|nr:fatty acid desaturase [Verrucomicrobiota bacterium]